MKRSKVDRLNRYLAELEEEKLQTNKLVSIKNALEVMNVNKRGNKERFSKSKSSLDNEIYEKLAKDFEQEYKRIKQAAKSEEFLKQEISLQDYLDQLDTESDYIVYIMERAGLSSTQLQDVFNIVKHKKIPTKDYQRVIRREIEKQLKAGEQDLGYRTVVEPDKLARYIRQSLYRFKDR